MAQAPLTWRYNNPLAVEFKPWMQGYGATLGPNGRYAQFPDPEQGYAVGNRILDTYAERGQNTVASIIGGLPNNPNLAWAPRSVDNNSTDLYIKSVASKLGVDPNAPLDTAQRRQLMEAMAAYESGKGPPPGAAPVSAQTLIDTPGAPPMQTKPTEDQGWLGLLSDRFQSPLFLMGASIFDNAYKPGGNIGAGMMQGMQAANLARRQKFAEMKDQREMEAQAQREDLIRGLPNQEWFKAMPAPLQGIVRGLPPEQAASVLVDYARSQNKSSDYGKSGAVFQGEDGRFYTIQFGSDGTRKVLPVEVNGTALSPAKGTTVVGDEVLNSATGQTVRNVGPQLQGGEAAKKRGQDMGEAQANLPTNLNTADLALKTIEKIRKHPGKESGLGVYGVAPAIPGTAQAGFVDLVEQARGQTFLEAFKSLRGGGAITEAEGRKAEQALARLNRARRPEDFEQALADLEDIIKTGIEVAKARASGPGRFSGPAGGGSPYSGMTNDDLKRQLGIR